MNRPIDIRRITLMALMAALVWVLTAQARIPIPATNGYIHLGDAGIAFAACAFGPWVAMLAGGLGTALADLMGYPQWAVFSLVIHGIQGWAMGQIVRKTVNAGTVVLSIAGGAFIVVAGYFAVSSVMSGANVALSEVPLNILQALGGSIVGVSLYFAVCRAYPPLRQYGERGR
ncbi:MAG: ECF transporter S component [Anaerolineae bacterium]|nr:ECF transporter S component [Anaerolineae bacterium]